MNSISAVKSRVRSNFGLVPCGVEATAHCAKGEFGSRCMCFETRFKPLFRLLTASSVQACPL